MSGTSEIVLDGEFLTPNQLWEIGYKPLSHVSVRISETALAKVRKARGVIDHILERSLVTGEAVYGINTGFGDLARVRIPQEQLCELQRNLIVSHAAGVGEPLSVPQTRMLLALRINVLCKGHSGIRPENLLKLLEALSLNCMPKVPAQGTVGASGDLAPLSHLALGLMGMGEMWDPQTGVLRDAAQVLRENGLSPLELHAKEGLALINGTQLITAIGSEALVRARRLAVQADIVSALTNDVLRGTTKAYDERIHAKRPHEGQGKVASRLRKLLHCSERPSEIFLDHENCTRVQDPYTMRCVPQVHGIVHDTIGFVGGVLATEVNSATDNPMVFYDESAPENDFTDSCILSGGNFHGEYPAKVLDYLAIGVHELSSISERRLERLVNSQLSELPAFLVHEGGLHSGFMIPHCTAAALVSENKTLCHPASVDSLSTSAAKEDHVSMGGFAARKALQVVKNVEYVLAIELFAACQALEFHRPLRSTAVLEKIHQSVREKVPFIAYDQYMSPHIEACAEYLRENMLCKVVREYFDGLDLSPEDAAEISTLFPLE